jgi:hypothetical protein
MTATPKALSRSVLTASSATLYTTPASTNTIITNIILANTTTSAVAVTLSLDGVIFIPAVSVAANSNAALDCRQVLAAGKTITGFAATGSAIGCHISGAETV